MSDRLTQDSATPLIPLVNRTRAALRVATGIFAVMLITALIWWVHEVDEDAEIGRVEELISDGHVNEALRILEPLLRVRPTIGAASRCAGIAYAKLNQFEPAVERFERVPREDPLRPDSCFRAGDILLLRLHQPSRAESFLLESLESNGSAPRAQGHLAGLYGLCGLTDLGLELRQQRLCSADFAEVDLVLLGLGDTAAENALALDEYIRVSPDDPLTQLARGQHAWQQHDFATARTFYESALVKRPDLADAQARLGRIFMELSDDLAFFNWHRQLNAAANDHAETWAVRGEWSLRQKDLNGAVRCFWEACRRDATHRRAHHQLGQTLAILGESHIAEAFQRRNDHLQRSLLAAKHYSTEATAVVAMECIAATSLCDHSWESWGWAEVVRNRFPQHSGPVKQIVRPEPQVPRVLVSAQPALRFDLSHFELPAWMRHTRDAVSPPIESPGVSHASGIRFTDDAERTGLRFEYINGDQVPGPGMRMFQFSGGGVGVMDYDRDGWPDLYFTQGGLWPVSEAVPPSDQLFRNRAGEAFEPVTGTAGLHDHDYGQGLAVGDFDCDGWPDLFVANVAGNRLLRNNGDGTFQDVTQGAGVGDKAWSTSAVCADLSGDGLPDLFVVNYLQGTDLLDRTCHQANGKPRACTPHEFDAAEDQLLLNLGDGRFQDVTADAGIRAPGGKGLGVLAADFDGTGRLSLFVGNDTTANFFFHNQTKHAGDFPRFDESAVVTGLAFDREGRTQACMGIAAADADGDGKLDLLVTNYFNESNTFYRQQSNLLFLDATAETGLREPSLKQLGFGTQFLDADLDGWPDLVVTNGHVDDETDRGIPLQMPTQVFRNEGKGRFIEVPEKQLGPWFHQRYLGRSLAILDWNRDGLEDFVISHLDSPASLMTNRSTRQGHSLTVRLIGTTAARDPVGTIVRVKTDSRLLYRQLLAGDGYQASNERQLVFGTGPDERVDISLVWPSGLQQSFTNVATEQTWLAIEGRPTLILTNP